MVVRIIKPCKNIFLCFFSGSIRPKYIFDGTKRTPYLINDKPDPLSAYGESKLAGENAVLASGVDALLIRTSWLYGAVGRNFVWTVIQRAREGRPMPTRELG